jgi:hypothetical protein
VKISTCSIIEFKPDTNAAKDEGRDQLRAYSTGIAKWYKLDKETLLSTYPNLASCANSEKSDLNLREEIITYELCSSIVRNDWGEVLNESTLEIPETGELLQIALQEQHGDLRQIRGNVRAGVAGRYDLGKAHGGEHLLEGSGAVAAKEGSADQHVPEHDSDGEQIGPTIERLAVDLLRAPTA